MKVVMGEKVPIKMWLNDIEQEALLQAERLASLPFVYRHVALMPDAHAGYGMPIGGVLATNGVIVPNAVGKDIGCGVRAVPLRINPEYVTRQNLEDIRDEILKRIPVGMGATRQVTMSAEWNRLIDKVGEFRYSDMRVISENESIAKRQLGTLGSGNHFIELQKGSDDLLWVMIHSGSRNLGAKVADYYDKVAKRLNQKWYSKVPKEWQLAFLPMQTEEFSAYLEEMRFCMAYAKENRRLMMNDVLDAVFTVFRKRFLCVEELFDEKHVIDTVHNYAEFGNYFGKNVIVHRKGAVKACLDEYVAIPGSQGTSSYIALGLGNEESFMSCSHGAGRVMSRSKARKVLDLEKEQERMKGIVHNMVTQSQLDEAPSAYKDIEDVMQNQSELVKPAMELKPLLSIKG